MKVCYNYKVKPDARVNSVIQRNGRAGETWSWIGSRFFPALDSLTDSREFLDRFYERPQAHSNQVNVHSCVIISTFYILICRLRLKLLLCFII